MNEGWGSEASAAVFFGGAEPFDEGVRLLGELSKEELIRIVIDDAQNWLAHSGLWFEAVDRRHGMAAAIAADREAWRIFTVLEARRIMARLKILPGGGISALVECLKHRFHARLNLQEFVEVSERRAVLRMVDCRMQSARRRKALPDLPCKTIGVVKYAEFASTVDPLIQTRCLTCPPDPCPDECCCAWEFTLTDS